MKLKNLDDGLESNGYTISAMTIDGHIGKPRTELIFYENLDDGHNVIRITPQDLVAVCRAVLDKVKINKKPLDK